MGKMPAVRQTHPKHYISRLQQRHVSRCICLASRMRLYIRKVCAEELLCSFNGQRLDFVNVTATAVIPSAWISLSVLVRHDASLGLQNRWGCIVFGSYELYVFFLTLGLSGNCIPNQRIGVPKSF